MVKQFVNARPTIDIDWIRYLNEERAKINALDLRGVKFVRRGKVVEVDPKLIERFELTGLSNMDFITSGYYKRGSKIFGVRDEDGNVAVIIEEIKLG